MKYSKEDILRKVENSTLDQKKAWSFVLLAILDHLENQRDNSRKRERVRVSIAITNINQAFKVFKESREGKNLTEVPL
jgi:KaiC/GvpD/RAD55 family RecA-like ATPase